MVFGRGGKTQQAPGEDPQILNERRAAGKHIATFNSKLQPQMQKYNSFANSQQATYWTYGYMGGTMVTCFAITKAIGAKIPVVGSIGPYLSLGVGWWGGGKLYEVHKTFYAATCVALLENGLKEMQELDEKHQGAIPEYTNQINEMKEMKKGLLLQQGQMDEETKKQMEEIQQKGSMDLDTRVDNLLAAYEKRKGPPKAA